MKGLEEKDLLGPELSQDTQNNQDFMEQKLIEHADMDGNPELNGLKEIELNDNVDTNEYVLVDTNGN